jgi:hypothetical protein
MKATFTIIAVLVFSALILAPSMPAEYPSKDIIVERNEIALKENNLNNLINKLETGVAIDSIKISSINK